MKSVVLIFPHQLFEKHPALKHDKRIVLIEEFLFFRQYKFHKQKLVFHRASMKAYQRYLIKNGYDVHYIDARDEIADVTKLLSFLKSEGCNQIHYCDGVDNYLGRRIITQSARLDLDLVRYESPCFFLSSEDAQLYFKSHKRFHQTDFYIEQRKESGPLTQITD